jgi:hypothetical protein
MTSLHVSYSAFFPSSGFPLVATIRNRLRWAGRANRCKAWSFT